MRRGAAQGGVMSRRDLQTSLLELVRRTSCDLPPDVAAALERARRRETRGTTARYALDVIRQNIALARETSRPISRACPNHLGR